MVEPAIAATKGTAIMVQPTPGRLTLIINQNRETAGNGDGVWDELRREAKEALARAPKLTRLFIDSILEQPSLEAAVFHRISQRLKNDVAPLPVLADAFGRAARAEPEIGRALRADIAAVLDRDPATQRFIEPFLYFKGFHALQTHRLAHWLWNNGERDFALYLQSRSSDVFQTDIHPAARFGRGIFLDHATGLVVGETAVVEDDVSLLQNVTLGGTGKESGDRHPKIRQGAIVGAGAKILGNIEIGAHSRIAAGSVVLRAVDPHSTVAGIPARTIRTTNDPEALRSKEEILKALSYESFDYSI
jgi:serine O-acetyltransferase